MLQLAEYCFHLEDFDCIDVKHREAFLQEEAIVMHLEFIEISFLHCCEGQCVKYDLEIEGYPLQLAEYRSLGGHLIVSM